MRNVLLLAERGVRKSVRNPATLFQTFLFPVVQLGAFLAAFTKTMQVGFAGDYADHLVPLLVLSTAAAGSLGVGAGIVAENRSGLTARLRTLPLRRVDALAGHVAAEVARVLAASIVLCAVGYLAGFRFEQGLAGAIGFFAISASFAMMFATLIGAVSLDARSVEKVTSHGPLLLLLMFFSGGFAPVETYPDAIQPFVSASPYTVGVDAMVGLTQGGGVVKPLMATCAWTLGLTTVFGVVAVRRLGQLDRA
jgi:ABC-2 type transport system permease protein